MATTKKLMGTTAVGGALAIEDVFSAYLYTGTSAAQTITNGIDLAGEGGMVWLKGRSNASNHFVVDTERGNDKYILTNATSAEGTSPAGSDITSFNSDGFSFGNYNYNINFNNYTYASWTFRKAPRFFDVVTYTGDGVAGRTVSHNLGVAPGCIIVKCTNLSRDWGVYHRGAAVIAEDVYLNLNLTNARSNSATYWNDTAPTDTEFTLGTALQVNQSGASYVAYLFAHDPLGPSGDGSDGLIACGSYTGNGSDTGPEIDLGWEPQWVLVKEASGSSAAFVGWYMFDNMRGLTASSANDASLRANESLAEDTGADYFAVQPTGFKCVTTNAGVNESGGTYIYIAIRRGPMRQPTSGTEVFAMDTLYSPGNEAPKWDATMPVVDMAIVAANTSTTNNKGFYARLTQGKYLKSNTTDAEASTAELFDAMYGWAPSATSSGPATTYPSWMFRRAPGFFDVVAYTGDGVAGRTVSHNLGVAPDMIWVKNRSQTYNWTVYCSELGNDKRLYLNLTDAASTTSTWNNTDPTATDFTVSNGVAVNASGIGHIAYLFATLPGVSKVGSYTGNGTSQTINCGFTSGARFILIKRTDSTGDWYIWDTERGIVAANDPHLSLNTNAAEVTTDDSVDPDNSGFIVNQVAATNINVSSASYIFYAVS